MKAYSYQPDRTDPGPFYAGLDLGQQHDHTALVVLDEEDPEDVEGHAYLTRLVRRFETGVPYTEIVEAVTAILSRPPLRGNTTLVLDATGVGRAVADLFRDLGKRFVAVTITGGQKAHTKGKEWTVPKKDLASTVQALLQTDRLRFSERVPQTETLLKELKDFRVKVSDSGHARFEHREGEHDDLVLGTALPAWYAEHGRAVYTGDTITL
jgi:hypothetical protein